MEIEGHVRRFRRHDGRVQQGGPHTLLPLHSSPLSNSLSCWYCDIKITSFNQPLYLFGQKHARFFRAWFTVGNGFSLSVLFGLSLILIWQLATTLCESCGSAKLDDVFSSLLIGIKPSVFGFNMSFIDVGYFIVSTVISVAVHEFGHAVAAASEGVQLEYISIFLAILFPGALVAFNYEILEAKPRSSALRIYCAGIWHNAVCCAACGLTLLLLPSILSPLYVHSENPMVLDISANSPVSGYLSHGDIIESLDGKMVHHQVDWMENAVSLVKHSRAISETMKGSINVDKRRIYCGPSSLVQKSEHVSLMGNRSTCPNERIAFVSIPCSNSSVNLDGSGEYDVQKIRDDVYCFAYADIVGLNNCATDGKRNCLCSENELCLSPVQMPGVAWAEVTYRSPHSPHCMKLEKNLSESVESSGFGEHCRKTFLYVGDVLSMVGSVRLTTFQPRYTFPWGSYFPFLVEKFLVCTFQVSMALALLNCLPVYFLDGEAILEGISFYVTCLNPRMRRLLLRACLCGGSITSSLVFLRMLL